MKRVRYAIAAIAASILVVSPVTSANAQVELSGNVSLVSDYVYRGFSQTLEEPAIQGGLDIAFPYDLYLGTWASSVNFGPGSEAALELDVYGGIAPSFGGFDFDLGALYYGYPGSRSESNFDFFEVLGGVSRAFGPLSAGLSAAYSPEFFGEVGPATWGELSASVAIPSSPVSLDGSLGKQWFSDLDDGDYIAWTAGASAEVVGITVGGGVIGTDVDDGACGGVCGTRFVVSVSRGM